MDNQNPPSLTKPLVEGIISLVLSFEGLAFPLVSGILATAYKTMAAGTATCRSENEADHPCTAQEIEAARTVTSSMLIVMLIAACLVLGAAVVLGLLAHRHASQADYIGKAKVGNILGMIGWILGAILLLVSIILAIVGLNGVR